MKELPADNKTGYSIRNGKKSIDDFQNPVTPNPSSKKAVIKLTETWEILRKVFDSLSLGCYLSNTGGNLQDCNKILEKITGYNENELVGNNIYQMGLYSERSSRKLRKYLSGNWNEKLFLPHESIINGKSGNEIAVELTIFPVTLGDREYQMHMVRDISGLKALEQEIERSRTNFYKVMERNADGIIIVDKEGIIRHTNPAAEILFDKNAEELIGMEFGIPVNGENVPDIEVPRSGGDIAFVKMYATEMEWEGKNAYMVLLHDITKHKQIKEEKDIIYSQFLHAQKMEAIGTLAGGIAHDFNNFLTAIRGYLELVLMEIGEDDPLRPDLEESLREASKAANLTRQLLLFGRRQLMKMIPINLNEIIKDMMKMIGRIIGEDITITYELEENLHTIKADPGNMEQVIINLIINARDAMPNGGRMLIKTENVSLRDKIVKPLCYVPPGNYVCFSLSDNGVGMNRKIIEHIFEPFFTTKGLRKGTGLGLPVLYGIIKQHKGWINVQSELGQGTTFKIYLSAVPLKPKQIIKVDNGSEIKYDLQGKNERILVVEDEKSISELTARILKKNGYIPRCASSATEAKRIFEKEKGDFSLIFSDVVLPDRDGLQLAENLLKVNSDIKVVFTSGYSDSKSRWNAIISKGFKFIQKPYSVNDLLKAVREVIKS